AIQRTEGDHLGQIQQEAELDGFHQVQVVAHALVLDRDRLVALLEPGDVGQGLAAGLVGAEHLDVGVHGLLQIAADVGDAVLGGGPVAQTLQQLDRGSLHTVGQLRHVDLVGVLCRGDAGAATEDVDVQQRVGAQADAAVHGDAGGLPGGVQARDHVGRVAQHLAADVGGDAPHAVVRGGEHRDRVRVRLHTQVGAGELGDVGQLRIDVRGLQV